MTGKTMDGPYGFDGLTEPPRIDCYVRPKHSPALLKQIESITDRIERLERAGLVDDFQVKQWPPRRQIPLESELSQPTRRGILADFEEWAHSNGFSLQPAFQRERVLPTTLGFDEPHEYIRVPQVSLALYMPGTEDLAGVLPSRELEPPEEGQVYTVAQWVRTLERRADPDAQLTDQEEPLSTH